jgi:hypothetical protein
MPDNIKPLSSLFPLIDDPANVFYAKLKNIFLSYPTTFLHVKALNRYTRVAEIQLPFSTRVWKVKQDVRTFPEVVTTDIDNHSTSNYNAYVIVEFFKTHKNNSETTTSGEVIPVDEYILSLQRVLKTFSFYKSKEKVIILQNDSSCVVVGFKAGDCIKKDHSLELVDSFDIYPHESKSSKEEYKGLYKPVVGRRIHFHKIESGIFTYWTWDLYDIDSELKAHLIDSVTVDFRDPDGSETIMDSQKSSGYNAVWPICYGPAIDHPTSLTFTKRVRYTPTDPDVTIEVMDNSFVPDRGSFVDISMNPNTDFVFDNRGLFIRSKTDLIDCLRDIRFYPRRHYTRRTQYYREEILLALCFIFNINFRHLYTNIFMGYPSSIRYFSGVFGTQADPHRFIGKTRVSMDHKTLNIPSTLRFSSTAVVPLNDISNMYNSALPGFSMVASVGDNTAALIQNSFSYNYVNTTSPFDRFRTANLDYLVKFRDAFKEPLHSAKIPLNNNISIYNFIKSLPSFCVDDSSLNNANMFSEVLDG